MKTEAERKRKSPSDVLIIKWSRYWKFGPLNISYDSHQKILCRHGHSITEFFKLLSDMQHFQAMNVIKNQVPSRYHIWIKPIQPQLTRLMGAQNFSAKINNANETAHHSQIFNDKVAQENNLQKADLKDNLKDLLNIPEIPIEELAIATNNWSDQNILGKGR